MTIPCAKKCCKLGQLLKPCFWKYDKNWKDLKIKPKRAQGIYLYIRRLSWIIALMNRLPLLAMREQTVLIDLIAFNSKSELHPNVGKMYCVLIQLYKNGNWIELNSTKSKRARLTEIDRIPDQESWFAAIAVSDAFSVALVSQAEHGLDSKWLAYDWGAPRSRRIAWDADALKSMSLTLTLIVESLRWFRQI